jgi:Ca2+-transporting ATPase
MNKELGIKNNGVDRLIPWHSQPVKEVLGTLGSRRNGLTQEEAIEKLEEYGQNALPAAPPKAMMTILLAQFASPFMAILIFAGVVSAVLGEFLDVGVITAAILINVILGFVEEYKADRSLEELQRYLPEEVRLRRNGQVMTVASEDIVPGDVLLIATGDKITADGRIIFERAFETNEAALTGESTSVRKSIEAVSAGDTVSDRTSMVFAGTVAVAGRAEVVVTDTAIHTEIGRISELVAEIKDEKTPLQDQLDAFARILGLAVLVLAAIIFTVGVIRGFDTAEMFYIAVALSVAAVPEGLIVAVTVVLAIGMQRILKKKALVRRLVAAETLGSVSVICMDKTGTLTTGIMTVDDLRIGNKAVSVESTDAEASYLRSQLQRVNATQVELDPESGEEKLKGSPTDLALYRYTRDFEESPDGERVSEVPFDSKRKFVAASYKKGDHYHVAVVGAPDVLLARADISDNERQKALATLDEMASRGLRVLLVGEMKDLPVHKELSANMIQDIDVLGFVGLRDPLRKEASTTIAQAISAGLRPVMITGDHPSTARVIASEAGLDVSEGAVLTGDDVDKLSDDRLLEIVEDVTVYARVLPKHKLRIIRAWQRKGHSVAMTGDGVNDAPAIKAADIGIALGSGTSVAKETADMVLLDNNFKTIVDAIKEGRIIFDNLRKMIVYLLADSFSEIILVFGAIVMGLPLPILPAQILWINLVADGLPAIALTFEPGEDEIMKEPPRKKGESILNREMLVLIFVIGVVTDIMLFIIFWYLNGKGLAIEEVRTFIYVALGIDSLFYVFAVRKFRRSIFRSNPFENKFLLVSILIGFVLLFGPMLYEPLRIAFEFTQLTMLEWGALVIIGFVQLLMIEAVKEVYNLKRRN